MENYTLGLVQLAEHLRSLGRDDDVKTVTAGDVREFLTALERRGMRPSSRYSRYSGCRQFFAWSSARRARQARRSLGWPGGTPWASGAIAVVDIDRQRAEDTTTAGLLRVSCNGAEFLGGDTASLNLGYRALSASPHEAPGAAGAS